MNQLMLIYKIFISCTNLFPIMRKQIFIITGRVGSRSNNFALVRSDRVRSEENN